MLLALIVAVAMHFFFIVTYLCCLLAYDYSSWEVFILQCSADAMIISQWHSKEYRGCRCCVHRTMHVKGTLELLRMML